MLTTVDPLTEAVVAEPDLPGNRARHTPNAGLRHGLASLGPV